MSEICFYSTNITQYFQVTLLPSSFQFIKATKVDEFPTTLKPSYFVEGYLILSELCG